ncbi:anoctamin-7-like [Clytia hemisphaerica]|uniref:Anoctamin n=1 Tax=Clytia hemisphaerica TaxID=252671 RepID=A0A7M5XNH7_9CNID
MSASENEHLVDFTDFTDTGSSRKSNGRRSNSANGKSTVDGHKRHRKKSNKHFQHKKQKLNIDFVLAAKNFDRYDDLTEKKRELDYLRKKYFHNLKKKRLKISKPFMSQDEKTYFWHVHAPFDVLADTAEDLNVRLPTVKNDIVVMLWYEKLTKRILEWWNKKNPFLVHNSYFSKPESYFADNFDKDRVEEFHNGNNPEKMFSPTERSRIVAYILESTKYGDNDDEIGKDGLLEKGVLTAAYPIHDGLLEPNENEPLLNNRQKLSREWASFGQIFKYQPIEGIKEYFGVKIAFYFAWIGFYTTWLVPASLIGLIFFFFGCLSNLWFIPVQEICNAEKPFFMCPLCDKVCSYYFLHNTSCTYSKMTHCFDNDGTPIFAVFISIWSVFYLEYWKRQQWSLSYEWHTMDFCEEEVVRPQYTASAKKFKQNPITRKMEPIASKKEQMLKIAGEASVVLFFIALVIAALIGVIVYRAVIFGILIAADGRLRKNSKLFVTGTAATINLIVINVLKLVYRKLALIMTEWENPRTRTSYEKSFTLKMFWFQFCNMFSSVFYVAFFKSEFFVGYPGNYRRFGTKRSRLEGCSEQGCFLELCIQLVILMGGQQLLGNFVEIFWPYLQKKYNRWRNNIKSDENMTVWEADYQLAEQEELQLFWEYQEVVLQYGFVTMFVAAFPLAPLIALITNLIEIRIDAINMIKAYRRPIAYKSEGIGVWYDILVTLTTIAVLVNGFVLSLTSEFIPRLVYKYRYSPDMTLTGYVEWSLSKFNISDFSPDESPLNMPEIEILQTHVFKRVNKTVCRYPGFHVNNESHEFSMVHWYLMTIRLMFAFLFQWIVSAAGRILAWIIPDRPRSLDLKIKRQEFLAKEALRNYKIKTGKRMPEAENVSEEEEESDTSESKRNSDQANGTTPETGNPSNRDNTDNAVDQDIRIKIPDRSASTMETTFLIDPEKKPTSPNYSFEYLTQML